RSLVLLSDPPDDTGPPHTLKLARTVETNTSEVLCLRYSEDGRFLVACCGDGKIIVYNPGTGNTISILHSNVTRGASKQQEAEDSPETDEPKSLFPVVELPCTCADFRPDVGGAKTGNVLVAGYSTGAIKHWHVPSGKVCFSLKVWGAGFSGAPGLTYLDDEACLTATWGGQAGTGHSDFGVQVLCCAYARDGKTFAAGASDSLIRVYDDNTKGLVARLRPGVGLGANAGHSSRVFSVKFTPSDPNILVSAGWDRCVHIWDVKRESTIRSIFGPHVCGDSLDVVGNAILTGSWRSHTQVELWDLNTGEPTKGIFWSAYVGSGGGSTTSCRLYAAAFSHAEGNEGRFIAAGGGDGSNEVKVYDLHNDYTLIGSLLGMSAGAISLCFSPSGERLAVGLANGKIHYVDIGTVDNDTQTTSSKVIMV
ncbi:unnamed protein product, partial [Discosporangium mesarthrocarpum]